MPKENTHILLVNKVMDSISCDATRELMAAHYGSLCLGSVVADTFFYSPDRGVVKVSDKLHGKDGEKTNELTFHLLERAKGERSDRLLCFTFGYISHCVFDMIFHPVIYYLAGNYYDPDPSKRDAAVYRHRLIETRLDNDLNRNYHLHDILKVDDSMLDEVMGIFAQRYDFQKEDLLRAFKKQVRGSRCFKSPFTYKLIYLLNKYKIIKFDQILPLFYSHLERDKLKLSETVDILDIVDGQPRRESLTAMFETVREESIRRIKAAHSFYACEIGREEAMRVIRGESLDTGREECPVTRITHPQ